MVTVSVFRVCDGSVSGGVMLTIDGEDCGLFSDGSSGAGSILCADATVGTWLDGNTCGVHG